jgi:quercetin dioxygenase-like cupin family protein
MTDRDASLMEYALGLSSPAERAEFEAELSTSPALVQELRCVREALALVPSTLPPAPEAARPQGRSALLAALYSGARFRPFADDLSHHFDLPRARMLELFSEIDDDAHYEAGPMPGIAVMHFPAGPGAVGRDTGFVRLAAGLQFPQHRHHGHEVNYVLSGALRDGDGTLYLPGEAIIKTPGSTHSFSVTPDKPALIAVVQDGFDIVAGP